jgi:hypothetical protein
MDDATFEIMIYVLVFAVAGVIFFGTKWLAAKFGPTNEGVAREAFEALDGFDPGEVHAYLGSAIAYDPVGTRLRSGRRPAARGLSIRAGFRSGIPGCC